METLVEVPQRSNTRVRVVAEQMIAAVTDKEPFLDRLRGHLVTAAKRRSVLEHRPGLTG
jgi:hypothetical protein